MDELAKKTRAKYFREWYHKNKEKHKVYQNNYWIRQAQKELAEMKPYDKEAGKHD